MNNSKERKFAGDYSIGVLSDEELVRLSSLFGLVWPNSKLTFDYISWLYRNNPLGFAQSFNVLDNGNIVGHYAAIPIEAELFGVKAKGLLSLNSAVHPNYRGHGFFKNLAMRTFDSARKKGYRFVIGVANANSTILFQRQLGFQIVRQLDVKIGIGEIFRSQNEENRHLDFKTCWSDSNLTWRLGRPGARYQWQKYPDLKKLLFDTGRFGIWGIVDGIPFDCCMTELSSHLKWNPVNIWIGLDPFCDWSKSLYVDLPQMLKPSPLNLIFKDLVEGERHLNSDRIRFSLLDFDAY